MNPNSLGTIQLTCGGAILSLVGADIEALRAAARKFGRIGLDAKHSRPKRADVSAVLQQVRDVVRLADSALQQTEAVKGVRLFEPNNLRLELMQLEWAIAALNGVTDAPPPRAHQ